MAEPTVLEPAPQEVDRLRRRVEEHRLKVQALMAELGDPDEAIDRIAEELFGTLESAQALLESVLEDIYGAGYDDQDATDER